MRRKKNNKKIYIALIKVLVEMIYDIRYVFVKELNNIAFVLQIAFPILLVKLDLTVPQMILFMVLFMGILKYIRDLFHELNGQTEIGIPIPRTRFTTVDNRGFVTYIDQNSKQEALLYLCDVEEYLERKGKL